MPDRSMRQINLTLCCQESQIESVFSGSGRKSAVIDRLKAVDWRVRIGEASAEQYAVGPGIGQIRRFQMVEVA